MASRLVSRRFALGGMAAASAGALLPRAAGAQAGAILTRPIGTSGERLPVIGLGTWIVFNVGQDRAGRSQCAEVMRQFFALGGQVIDSSPMYGSSQGVIGEGITRLGVKQGTEPGRLFAATKVWIASPAAGPKQIEESRGLWGVERFDLLQVHNLLSWDKHLETLRAMKVEGRVRYIGVTTSHGMRHPELEKILESEAIDFVQLTYNIQDREAEKRLLPMAQERGIAVLANRPFRQGELIDAVQRHKLPSIAQEIGCANWAQFLLKFVVSHPAVTCAIPATSRVDHLQENMGAAHGPLPDPAMRARMIAAMRSV